MEAGTPSTAPLPSRAPRLFSPHSLLLYWLPVALWMALIFGMSTGLGASHRTSRIIGPILRWFNPQVSDETIRGIQLGIRKTAHVTEYAILALLCLRALRQTRSGERRPWNTRTAIIALTITVLYAATDEWHQSFVPGREGAVRDVLIDAAGGSAGLLLNWWLMRRRQRG
jgi:VanZ family protein